MGIFDNLFGKKEHPAKKHKDHVGCDFGKKEFNKIKRDKKFVDELNALTIAEASRKGGGGGGKGKPVKTSTTTTTTTNLSSGGGVVLIDFDGYLVENTSWNYNGPINCAYSGLTLDEQQMVINGIKEDYAPFDVLITTDESIYNATPANKRMRCIITETWEWYGQAGGVAFVGSFSWGTEAPCFVFSSLLGYNIKNIFEAASHEIGHTLGLYHQSSYNADCVKTAEYNTGCCGEAPIMGVAYYQPVGKWWIGPNSYGCNSIQDDFKILRGVLGLK